MPKRLEIASVDRPPPRRVSKQQKPHRHAPAAPSRKAGRPTSEGAEAIDIAIMAVARQHILELGFEKASMEAIAAGAKVSKPTLYARFPSKEVLLRAIIDAEAAALSEHNVRKFEAGKPKDLKRLLQLHAQSAMLAMLSPEVRALDRISVDPGLPTRELPDWLYARELKGIDEIASDIVSATKAFRPAPRNPTRIAEMLLAALDGWHELHRRDFQRSTEEALEYADHVADVLFAGRASW